MYAICFAKIDISTSENAVQIKEYDSGYPFV